MKNTMSAKDLLNALTDNLSKSDLVETYIGSQLSNAIAARRISMGLSQSELAKKIGKTQATISKWENGDMNFTISTLSEIATYLDLNLNVSLTPPVAHSSVGKVISFYNSSNWSVKSSHSDYELKEN